MWGEERVAAAAGRLAEVLAGLAVRVEEVRWRTGLVAVDDYPGGRPSTLVQLSGASQVGFGELVSFSAEEHAAFGQSLPGWLPVGEGRVGELVPASAPAHARAAVEAALIDLGMRQARMSLTGVQLGEGPDGPVEVGLRWVVSLGAEVDPRPALAARVRVPTPAAELKLDVHGGWSDEVIESLRTEHRVAILDFKEGGKPELAERLSTAFPEAIFEDPPAGCAHRLIARDRPLARVEDVAAALARGELVNLKGPRMGGFLAVLRALEMNQKGRAYFGGMFEVGPGREQARQLAALFCPQAPNDLAPFPGGTSSLEGASPSRIRLDHPGFGSNLDWSGQPI